MLMRGQRDGITRCLRRTDPHLVLARLTNVAVQCWVVLEKPVDGDQGSFHPSRAHPSRYRAPKRWSREKPTRACVLQRGPHVLGRPIATGWSLSRPSHPRPSPQRARSALFAFPGASGCPPTRNGAVAQRQSGCLGGLGRSLADGVGDIANHLVHQPLVVAFGHHADHGLCPRGTDDKPAIAAEPGLTSIDRLFDEILLERRTVLIGHVLQDLG